MIARESASHLLAAGAAIQEHVNAIGLGPPHQKADLLALYDQLVTHPDLIGATRKLFADGHYALAVEECYKCLNNKVKAKSALTVDGATLMTQAFSLNNPALAFSDLKSQSKRDEQVGYMQILAGCMTGIRNPRAHEHQYLDQAEVALDLLSLGNHLMFKVDTAVRKRCRQKAGKH